MIINSLDRIENSSNYKVIIDNEKYILDESVILKYRLFPNTTIDDSIIESLIKYNDYINYYNKALNYTVKYAKPSKAISDYLLSKACPNNYIPLIIKDLQDKKILNDDILCRSYISYLITNYNGRLMISKKLYEKGFTKEVINNSMEAIDINLYNEALMKCYNKHKNKYNKYDSYIAKQKLKNYLLSRGYTINDISIIEFE